MTQAAEGDQLGPGRLVEVTVDAEASQVPLVRAIAADVAMRHDFDLDTIEDLRMAVDEACSLLVGFARRPSRLRCTFQLDDQQIEVGLAVDSVDDVELPRQSMGWQILAALSTQVDGRVVASEGGHTVSIDLVRARAEKISA